MYDYKGVLSTDKGQYKIYSNDEDIDISYILKYHYYKESQLHIKISNSVRVILNEYGDLYMDRDTNRKYKYHINGRNLEQILNNNLNKLLEITISERSLAET
jgi:hypothetical protein